MHRRQLGRSSFEFTTVGLGTWAIGGGDWLYGWGSQDEQEAIAAIVRAVDLGINWIDTAAVYGEGKSEELVGRALKQIDNQTKPLIATKCSRIFQPDGTITGCLKPASIVAECEASLRRLDVEAIDLYQLHWPDPPEEIEDGWATLVELKQQGKVREIGVSNHDVAQMKRLEAIHPIASLQPPYNMLMTGIEDEILPFCQDHNIGVICYSPMCKGLLTGKFDLDRAATLPANDHRSRDPKFQSPQLEVNLQLVQDLRPIAEAHGRSMAELSIAWVLRRPEVTSAIVGARRPAQIEATVEAGNWQLSEAEQATIEECLLRRLATLEKLGVRRLAVFRSLGVVSWKPGPCSGASFRPEGRATNQPSAERT